MFQKSVKKLNSKRLYTKNISFIFFKKHLTAEEISNEIKENYNVSIGIATVYRAVKFLHDMKLVNMLDVGDSSIRYELNLSEHHDHLICESCGKLLNLEMI